MKYAYLVSDSLKLTRQPVSLPGIAFQVNAIFSIRIIMGLLIFPNLSGHLELAKDVAQAFAEAFEYFTT